VIVVFFVLFLKFLPCFSVVLVTFLIKVYYEVKMKNQIFLLWKS